MMSRTDKSEKLENELKQEEKKEKRGKYIKKIVKVIFTLVIIFILFILYMHFIGTTGLKVREYKVESNNLPDNFHGFKIVQFSDLHYLTTINKKEVKNIINKINRLKPDVVVFTGDLIDKNKIPTEEDLNTLVTYFNKIEATTGLYAIKGNEDYSNDYFEKVFNQTKFKILSNTYELVYYKGTTPILLTGTGSILNNDCDFNKAFSYSEMDNLYTISLIHEPDITDSIIDKYHIDLILAGHNHNGQIRLFPGSKGILKPNEGKIYSKEQYTINDTKLFISGGLGTSNYEFRLFTRPSINLYRLVKEKEAK